MVQTLHLCVCAVLFYLNLHLKVHPEVDHQYFWYHFKDQNMICNEGPFSAKCRTHGKSVRGFIVI